MSNFDSAENKSIQGEPLNWTDFYPDNDQNGKVVSVPILAITDKNGSELKIGNYVRCDGVDKEFGFWRYRLPVTILDIAMQRTMMVALVRHPKFGLMWLNTRSLEFIDEETAIFERLSQ